jgi:hypothetical protein
MNNPPAFPVLIVDRPEELTHFNGMTLRDYFAAKAMPIYLQRFGSSEGFSQLETCILVADWSYEMADAMLAAREEA